jgi:hypothetical protein
MGNIWYENSFIALNPIKGEPICSCELFIVLSTQSDQTIAPERRVRSRRGMTCIASDMTYVITVHGVIYSEYISQKYLAKYELVTSFMCIQKLYCT